MSREELLNDLKRNDELADMFDKTLDDFEDSLSKKKLESIFYRLANEYEIVLHELYDTQETLKTYKKRLKYWA